MASKLATFGDPARFEIAVRWGKDDEPRDRRPSVYGWSSGLLKLTVNGQILTRSRRGTRLETSTAGKFVVARKVGVDVGNAIVWYLSPLFYWLADNWAHLLHEEAYAWPDHDGAPAVVACADHLERFIDATDAEGRRQYEQTHAWRGRHALRVAAEGGLFPDLFIRRLRDEIELSWRNEAPEFAPAGFAFEFASGLARLAVADVAGPLWEALQWCTSTAPPGLSAEDRQDWDTLARRIDAIPAIPPEAYDAAYADASLIGKVREALKAAGREDLVREEIARERPYVAYFAPAVACFGGVSPTLADADINAICGLLVGKAGAGDGPALAKLLEEGASDLVLEAHKEGYALAEEFLENFDADLNGEWIDIRDIAAKLGIDIVEQALVTGSIRGVALAGEGFAPTILVNTSSVYNANEFGKRFTVAHELCHILYDRSRARRVAHISGPWASQRVERRANAFAAYALMPRALIVRHSASGFAQASVVQLAQQLRVNLSALAPHLCNLDFIDEVQRDELSQRLL